MTDVIKKDLQELEDRLSDVARKARERHINPLGVDRHRYEDQAGEGCGGFGLNLNRNELQSTIARPP